MCDEYTAYVKKLCGKRHVTFEDFQADIIKKCLGTPICPGKNYEFMCNVLKKLQKDKPSMTFLEDDFLLTNTDCHLIELPIDFSTSGKKRLGCIINRTVEQEFSGKYAHGSIRLTRAFTNIRSIVFPKGYTPVWYTVNSAKFAISEKVLVFSDKGCEWLMELPIHIAVYCDIEIFFKETIRSGNDTGYINGYNIPFDIKNALMRCPAIINEFSDPSRKLIITNGIMNEIPN